MSIHKPASSIVAIALCVLPVLAFADNDLCNNVRFKFTNSHPTERAIAVTGIEYEDVVNNRQVSRNIARVVCNYGDTCLTDAKSLKDVEGNAIKGVRLVYKYKERDKDWSDKTRTEAFDPEHKECRADRVYGPGPRGFVIGNGPAP